MLAQKGMLSTNCIHQRLMVVYSYITENIMREPQGVYFTHSPLCMPKTNPRAHRNEKKVNSNCAAAPALLLDDTGRDDEAINNNKKSANFVDTEFVKPCTQKRGKRFAQQQCSGVVQDPAWCHEG